MKAANKIEPPPFLVLWRRLEQELSHRAPVFWQTRQLLRLSALVLAFDGLVLVAAALQYWRVLPTSWAESAVPVLFFVALFSPLVIGVFVLESFWRQPVWWRRDWLKGLAVQIAVLFVVYLAAPFAIWLGFAWTGSPELAHYSYRKIIGALPSQLGLALFCTAIGLLILFFAPSRLSPPRLDLRRLATWQSLLPRIKVDTGARAQRSWADFIAARWPFVWSTRIYFTAPLLIAYYALVAVFYASGLLVDAVDRFELEADRRAVVHFLLIAGPMIPWIDLKRTRPQARSGLVDGLTAAAIILELLILAAVALLLSSWAGLWTHFLPTDADMAGITTIVTALMALYAVHRVVGSYTERGDGTWRAWLRWWVAMGWVIATVMSVLFSLFIFLLHFWGVAPAPGELSELPFEVPWAALVLITTPVALALTGGGIRRGYFAPRRE